MSSSARSFFRRATAALVAAVFFLSSAGIASYAQEAAAFLGTVFDPSGKPAEGFTVVFRDVASGKEIRSSKTNPSGQYQATVPVGGRYKLQSVVAPDGTTLPVQDVPPIAVRVPGNNRLDVRFIAKAATPPAPVAAVAPPPRPSAPAAPAKPVETAKTTPPPKAAPAKPAPPKPAPSKPTPVVAKKEKKDRSGLPWWKKPAGIVGIVLGTGAVVALAAGGGGGSNGGTTSPSQPGK